MESLEQLQITDYSPKKNRFLVYGTISKKCMEIDRNGKIISEVDLNGEGPGHFGQGITELSYFGEDIILNGPNVYLTYDGNWNYKERIVYTSGGAWLPLGMIPGATESIVKSDKAAIVKPFDHTYFGTKKVANNHFSKAKMIEVISYPSQESKTLLEYPRQSVYQSQSTYYSNHKAILSHNPANDRLYIALPLEPKIYEYDTDDFNLLNTYTLDLTSFRAPQGIPFEDQHKNGRRGFGPTNRLNSVYSYANSMIFSLSSKGDITIVEYKTGFKEATNTSTIEEASQISKMENRPFTAFFKGDKKIAELEKRFTKMVRMTDYSFLAHEINTEEELDYSKFYIYELREVN
ncbi:hypothetical protein [Roseivirga pacifica]|uniref:hypothetical protein n=1 Tax=Roseivirga pacifica TaxID=1267423 RepID=UPI00227AE50B|nr:hypothetical protein [Roseivirga pacifica]